MVLSFDLEDEEILDFFWDKDEDPPLVVKKREKSIVYDKEKGKVVDKEEIN